MIVTRTPFRISFFGGGTDYPAYYNEHEGAVLSTSINHYCHVLLRYLPPFFDHRYRIRYTHREETQTLAQIQHPSVRACLEFTQMPHGVEMVHSGDIPARSGIGSSSAFTVGLLNAIYALQGKMVAKRHLAYDAIHVEQEVLGEAVGAQDQVAAAFGGFNRIVFGGASQLFVQPVILTRQKLQYLQDCLLFYFTGFSRTADAIAREQIKATGDKLSELHTMRQMVDRAIEILNGPLADYNDFGALLDESWRLKRELTPHITNRYLDEIYDVARRAGAAGGKLCGAGGGGFFLFFVPPEKQPAVKKALRKLLRVPFRFEEMGSHVAFHTHEEPPPDFTWTGPREVEDVESYFDLLEEPNGGEPV